MRLVELEDGDFIGGREVERFKRERGVPLVLVECVVPKDKSAAVPGYARFRSCPIARAVAVHVRRPLTVGVTLGARAVPSLNRAGALYVVQLRPLRVAWEAPLPATVRDLVRLHPDTTAGRRAWEGLRFSVWLPRPLVRAASVREYYKAQGLDADAVRTRTGDEEPGRGVA